MNDELKDKQNAAVDALADLFYYHCALAGAYREQGDVALSSYHAGRCATIIAAKNVMERDGVFDGKL